MGTSLFSRIATDNQTNDHGQSAHRQQPANKRSQWRAWPTATLVLTLVFMLSACSDLSSNGGDGDEPKGPPASPQSLKFTYPYNGQQDVVRGTQIVATFGTAVTDDLSGFVLVDMTGSGDAPAIEVVQDSNQPNIYRITPVDAAGHTVDLAAETTYQVSLNGDTLFRFTTRPVAGRPAGEEGFKVVARTPGTTNPVTGVVLPFTEFNAIRLRLSGPVDPSTVVKGETFTFTTGGEPVDGRLTALGRYITFDPLNDLDSGKTYTLTLNAPVTAGDGADTAGVVSQFGAPLAGTYTDVLTPLDTGEETQQVLRVEPTAQDAASLPDNPLNGLATNVAVIKSQLIGVNKQPAFNATNRGGLATTLAEGTLENPATPIEDTVFPGVVRAGQKVQLQRLDLKLAGVVDTPVTSGPIDGVFVNDVDVYLLANQLRKGVQPTAVRLRFDLGVANQLIAPAGTPESIIQGLANGVFNQTVMNIQAAGTAVAADNGDLIINAVGSFPIKVNRTGTAAIDIELQLVLSAQPPEPVGDDVVAPFVTAQYPSSCLYAFGSPAYYAVYTANGASPTALPELICSDGPQEGAADPIAVSITSFPVEASPSIVFSEPLEPLTVSDQSVALMLNGTAVPAGLSVEGSSIVIDPVDVLEADTDYTIKLGVNGTLTDLAGNAVFYGNVLGPGQTITFHTEPLAEDGTPAAPLLGTLSPGIPCVLEGGTFRDGGDIAGNCAGDSGASEPFPVFKNPANVTVDAFLSKFVQANTIVLADGCLTAGSPAAGNDGTVAVQIMDGSGQCTGVVPGKIAFGNVGDELTSAFSFRPSNNFEPGQRYWIVITNGITGADELALNTNPLEGTASTVTPGPTTDSDSSNDPNIVIPFDAIAATTDYYANLLTVPYSDTNGNGQFDDGEVPQPANRTMVNLSIGALSLGSYPSYLSLTRPIAIRDTVTDCSDDIFTDASSLPEGTLTVSSPACIKVSLLPGGVSALTSINLSLDAVTGLLAGLPGTTPIGDIPILGPLLDGLLGTVDDLVSRLIDAIPAPLDALVKPIQTGRILLRYPAEAGESGPSGVAQTGYIVESCAGTLAGQAYDFEPCFVATLTLVANAPDSQLVTLAQQTLTATIAGPVTFEQNGRLIISLTNLNALTLNADVSLGDLPLLPATATIKPGDLKLQLAGQAVHGGHAFPVR